MIRLAREAVLRQPEPAEPVPLPEPPAVEPPAPISEPARRLLDARKRHITRVEPPTPMAAGRPEVSRRARTLASLALGIGLIVLGLMVFAAWMASAP